MSVCLGWALLLIVPAIVISFVYFYGQYSWHKETKLLHDKMYSVSIRTTAGISTYDPCEVQGLPDPVQRYFRAVLRDGQPIVSGVRVEHTGMFNMGKNRDQWKPFRSVQHVSARRPGFVWDANIGIMPGMPVRVHDAYAAGEGVLTAKLLGLIKVMEMSPSPELAHGELMRFFAEGAWYPTSLLPGQGVAWEAIDDFQAVGVLRDGASEVRLVFQFDDRGLISAVKSEGRYRDIDGVLSAYPWQGRHWDYQEREGMLVPLAGEVAWVLPEGLRPYWRGYIEKIEYEFGQVNQLSV